MKSSTVVKLVILAGVLAFAAKWIFFPGGEQAGKQGGGRGKGGPVSVGSAPAQQGSIDLYITGLGNVTPQNTVTVRSRVDGQLMQLHFKEGEEVKEGQLLAELDAKPFEAELKQAEGVKMRDEALLMEARVNLERYQTLLKQDAIPRQQLDSQSSLVKQYEGAVKNDQGAIDIARTQLEYTRIHSPINGRAGLRLVDPGNIVHTSDEGIVVVTQLHPITALFTIPEDRINEVLQNQNPERPLTAEAWDRENTTLLARGTLAAIDNRVDATTGTVKMRAEFDNRDNRLFPSQFVNIRLKVATHENVLLVPAAAVQQGTQGPFVYRIKPDNTVEMITVKLGTTEAGRAEVKEGLAEGDKVVTDGADMLRDGAAILPAETAKEAGKDPAAHADPKKAPPPEGSGR